MASLSQSIKPEAYSPPTREQIERARMMYVEGFTVSRILAHCDMSLGTLYYWLDGGPCAVPATGKPTAGGATKGPALPPIPRRKVIVGKRRRALKADPVSLHARLLRTCERQARDTEERLKRLDGPPDERDIRMLALLVRSLRDLTRLHAERAADDAPGTDDDVPGDVDALRAELSRRLDAMAQSDAGEGTARAG
jgi:AcrR family transcriptional regulator